MQARDEYTLLRARRERGSLLLTRRVHSAVKVMDLDKVPEEKAAGKDPEEEAAAGGARDS